MAVLIREYEDTDFLSVKDILIEAFPEINEFLVKTLVDNNVLNLDRKRHMQLVAVDDGVVVGYVLVLRNFDPLMGKTNFWIDYVCVKSDARGKGIGKTLLKKVEEIAISEDVLFLQLTSSRFRTAARKLYVDMGFEIRESDIFRKVLK